MNKVILSTGIIILLLTIVFSGCFEENKKEEKLSIQQLINNAAPGDTVIIPKGVYYENIMIDKTINLIGEDKNTTIIDGRGSGHVLNLSADHINVSGFTIQNSGDEWGYAEIGIYSNYNSITKNIIIDKGDGIYLYHSNNNIISGNTIQNNTYYGINIQYSSNNFIFDNSIVNNGDGMNFYYSDNNIISGNIMNSNTGGIISGYSSNNFISDNTFGHNTNGVYLFSSNNNTISGNNINNNSYTGMEFNSCNNNIIYHNNLVDNIQNARSTGNNIWYNATLKEGNYWDDYNGTDANGDYIGDISYNITFEVNQDSYPLMRIYV